MGRGCLPWEGPIGSCSVTHPSSQADCLPPALRNHLQLEAVDTAHCCPLPTGWLNRQRCFLLGVGMARLGSLPLHSPPILLLPIRPSSPRPQNHTRTFWSVWESKGAGVSAYLFLLLQPHFPRLQQTPGRWWKTSPWALESDKRGSKSSSPPAALWPQARCFIYLASVSPSVAWG